MKKVVTLLGMGMLFTLASNAQAQFGGWGGWGYPGYASATSGTQAAGVGISEVIRARGQYAKDIGQARILDAQAQSAESDARLQHVQDYFAMRKVNQDYMKQQEAERYHPTSQVLHRIATDQLPPRLANSKLDPNTGKITWPELLTTPEFASDREKLEALFSDRALSGGGLGTENHIMIEREAKNMLEKLKSHIQDVDAGDYLTCRNFIESLSFESRFAVN
ncbi:MAG: hypothetical protein U1D30_14570 [Planctomycetota bacterium]